MEKRTIKKKHFWHQKAPTSGLVSCARFGSWQKCPESFWVHAWQTRKNCRSSVILWLEDPQKPNTNNKLRAGDCECALFLRFKRGIVSTYQLCYKILMLKREVQWKEPTPRRDASSHQNRHTFLKEASSSLEQSPPSKVKSFLEMSNSFLKKIW